HCQLSALAWCLFDQSEFHWSRFLPRIRHFVDSFGLTVVSTKHTASVVPNY
ncbi:MAG: hypothetical protein ACI9FB_004257, partial [Candidatus Azotimanducaceae bacterium]